MKKLLTFLILLTCYTTHAQIQIGQDIDGEAADDWSGEAICMPDAYTVAIGAPYNDGYSGYAFDDRGQVRIYFLKSNDWVQKGQDIDGKEGPVVFNGVASSDYFGQTVSMPNANTIAVGSIIGDSTEGSVKVYIFNGNNWQQKGSEINGEKIGDKAFEISMPDANTIAIGSPGSDKKAYNAGQVRIYKWSGIAWIQKGLDIYGEAADDFSGSSVSMPDANTVAIGAPNNDGDGNNGDAIGQVRIFTWNGSTWIQKGNDIDGFYKEVMLGESVSMPDANTVAFGGGGYAAFSDHKGIVIVYYWNGSMWVKKGQDIIGEEIGDYSGTSISMPDANTIAISAYKNDGNGVNSGCVRIYKWNGSSWIKNGISIDGEAAYDHSGSSVSMPDPYTVAIGGFQNDGNGAYSGHVRIYNLKGMHGLVYNDVNQNCSKEESGIVSGVNGIIQPGNIVVQTNSKGLWVCDSLPIGNYTITFNTTGNWKASCAQTQNFSVTDPNGLKQLPNFGMVNINPCAEPNISIVMPRMRPGFSNQNIYVKACNEKTATGVLNNAYVILEVDSLLVPQSATLNYTNLGNNKYRFDLGDLNAGECKLLIVSCSLSIKALLGQTLCMEAQLFPQPNCVFDSITPAPTPPDFTPCTLPWDKSSIKVDGWCKNDSIYFTITNTGELGGGDMDCYSPVRLYIDGQYMWLDSIKLLGGTTDTLVYTGDGRTWRLEVDQHPLHRGYSKPNASIERCGNTTNWTPDLVNILPMDDDDPIVDIYCGLVTGSYDPNDKRGFPLGISDTHFVAPNGKMDYIIRFQNTGTDTAFTVVIRDTLDTDLDIFSVRSGASSHNYSFRMYGPRVLEWTFNNILLPDSGTNQAGSNGFVSFTVNQVKNLPDFTEINNSGAIYFDFNAPVITNSTSHIVKRSIGLPTWRNTKMVSLTKCDQFAHNDEYYTKTGKYWYLEEDTLFELDLLIKKSTYTSQTITACNSYISPSGKWYDTTNIYFDTLSNSVNCDSIITTNLILNKSYLYLKINNCAEDFIVSPSGNTISSNGIYFDTLINQKGCDSIITIDIVFNDTSFSELNVSDCYSYTAPSGKVLMSSGTYMDTIPNKTGCDSIITINFVLKQKSYSILNASACHSYISPSGKVYFANGTYKDTIPNTAGCDSIITINLLIKNTFSTLVKPACSPYISPSGKELFKSGTYKDTIANALGCDSIITLYLILNDNFSSKKVTECNSYVSPSGKVYESSGIYLDTLTNKMGCDSIITIDLTLIVNSYLDTTITVCNNFTTPSGKQLTTSGIYSDTISNEVKCDSIITIDLTVNYSDTTLIDTILYSEISNSLLVGDTVLNKIGKHIVTLINSQGCDSIVIVTLDIIEPEPIITDFKIYPNPTNGTLTVDFGYQMSQVSIQIIDITGKVVFNVNNLEGTQAIINFEATKGIYFVRFNSPFENKVVKLIRE